MPAAYQSASSVQGVSVSTLQITLTLSGSNLALIVFIGIGNFDQFGGGGTPASVSSLVWNTSEAPTLVYNELSTDGFMRNLGYALAAPTSGTHNVDLTVSASAPQIYLAGVGVTGAHQTTPVTPTTGYAIARGSSITPSVTIASATNDLVLDNSFSRSPGLSFGGPGAGQTQIWQQDSLGTPDLGSGSGSWEAGGSSVVMSWTTDDNRAWITGAMNVNDLNKVIGGGSVVEAQFQPQFRGMGNGMFRKMRHPRHGSAMAFRKAA